MAVRAQRPPGRLRLIQGGQAATEPPSDEQLISAVERGDRAVGEHLHDRLIRSVDATLHRVLGRRDREHDELVQAAFERIVVTLARSRFTKACSLASWASAVTCSVALDALRSRRTERREPDPRPAASREGPRGADVERMVAVDREFQRLRTELVRMKSERAEALLLNDMLGHELSEMAVLLGVSVSTAQSRLARGRQELQERLAEEGGA